MPSAFAVLRLIISSNLLNYLHRQVCRFCAFENYRRINTKLVIGVGDAYAIAQQSARQDIFAKLVDGWHSLSFRESNDTIAPRIEVRVGRN